MLGEGEVAGKRDSRTEEFVRELTANAPRIYSYILSLLPNWPDADEVFQETSLLLWQKFDEYEPGTNFRAWAFQVAFHKVLQSRQRQRKNVLAFSEQFIDTIHRDALARSATLDARLEALADCFGKLRPQDRDLIDRRYRPGSTTRGVAQQVGRSVDAVYKALNRIHQSLLECVARKTAEGGTL